MNLRKGFTIIELLVVISIISLLSSITLAVLSSTRSKARDAVRKSDVYHLNLAIQSYVLDHDAYPVGEDDYNSGLDSSNLGTGFIPTLVSENYLSAPVKNPQPGGVYWYGWRNSTSGNGNLFTLECGSGSTAKAFLLYVLESGEQKITCYQ